MTLLRSVIVGMPQFLNPAKCVLKSSNTIGQVFSNYQSFHVILCSAVYSFPVISNAGWLMWHSFPHQHQRQHSRIQDTSGEVLFLISMAREIWGPDYHWGEVG